MIKPAGGAAPLPPPLSFRPLLCRKMKSHLNVCFLPPSPPGGRTTSHAAPGASLTPPLVGRGQGRDNWDDDGEEVALVWEIAIIAGVVLVVTVWCFVVEWALGMMGSL